MAEPAQAVSPAAGVENSFIREGEFWSLAYAGTVTRVKDSKGVRDVAKLIAAAGRALRRWTWWAAAADDRSRRRAGCAPRVLRVRCSTRRPGRSTGLGWSSWRRRSGRRQVQRPSPGGRARDERTFLLAELGAAVGLAGRPRLALDPAERARKAVAWRVRNSINHIEAAHPALGRHLRHAVRTGSFCKYDPDQPTSGGCNRGQCRASGGRAHTVKHL